MRVRTGNPSLPLVVGLGAIAGSPLLEVTTGQDALYGLWLAVLMVGVWVAQRLSRREVGIALGDPASYLIAIGYVAGIIGAVALGAWASGLIDLEHYSSGKAFRRVSLNFLVTLVLALVTEEGFFRGALWGSCLRAGFSPMQTVVWTSVAFGLWHAAVPIIEPDFAQPLDKVPQYVLGSTVFGIAMGLLRLRSGSILVPSFCHALWNASAYTFFGAGERVGQLGIKDPSWWDPERGYAGLLMAMAATAVLWRAVGPARAVAPAGRA